MRDAGIVGCARADAVFVFIAPAVGKNATKTSVVNVIAVLVAARVNHITTDLFVIMPILHS